MKLLYLTDWYQSRYMSKASFPDFVAPVSQKITRNIENYYNELSYQDLYDLPFYPLFLWLTLHLQ